MARKLLIGSGILIGLYLLVSHATDAGKLLNSAGSAASGYAKTLQGR